jgi:hypothetical protein
VSRTRHRAEAGRHGGIRVGPEGRGDAHRERRGGQLVVGQQDEDVVDRGHDIGTAARHADPRRHLRSNRPRGTARHRGHGVGDHAPRRGDGARGSGIGAQRIEGPEHADDDAQLIGGASRGRQRLERRAGVRERVGIHRPRARREDVLALPQPFRHRLVGP